MPQTYKELHAEKHKLEVKETLATVYQVLKLVKICADNSTTFEEFSNLLNNTLDKVEKKMNE